MCYNKVETAIFCIKFGGFILSNMLYDQEIEDELMIQFIILYALNNADEALPYSDLLSVIQNNCEINFTELQLGLDNLIQTGHVSVSHLSDILSVYDVTEKGKYVIDFFYTRIPLIIREPINETIKELYIEKRRREAVQARVMPINEREYNAECYLRNDDKTLMMSLSLYAGDRDEAERLVRCFEADSERIYSSIIGLFDDFSVSGDDENEE